MIQTILSKCLDELAKEKPDLSYIRGMLEVLLASQEKPEIKINPAKQIISVNADVPKDEGSILDSAARAKLEDVKRIAHASLE